MRAEIVKSGCSLETRKLQAFYSATIFHPNTRREFFNRIDPDLPVATDRIGKVRNWLFSNVRYVTTSRIEC